MKVGEIVESKVVYSPGDPINATLEGNAGKRNSRKSVRFAVFLHKVAVVPVDFAFEFPMEIGAGAGTGGRCKEVWKEGWQNRGWWWSGNKAR